MEKEVINYIVVFKWQEGQAIVPFRANLCRIGHLSARTKDINLNLWGLNASLFAKTFTKAPNIYFKSANTVILYVNIAGNEINF